MPKNRIVLALGASMATFAIAACSSFSAPRSADQYNDDASINTKVQAAVVSMPGIHANDIQVTTYRGVVNIKGMADSQQAAVDAVEAARNVDGVKEVNYDIQVEKDTK